MSDLANSLRCTNCDAVVADRFCPACGQQRFERSHLQLRHLFREGLREVVGIDGRLFRTIPPLLFQPGYLTQQYLSGVQRKYLKPLSLFILVNLFFFLFGYRMGLMHWSMAFANGETGKQMVFERAAAIGSDPGSYLVQLNSVMAEYLRSLFFGIIPLFAGAMQLFYLRRKAGYGEFLIYSIHYHSSYLIIMPVSAVIVISLLAVVDLAAGTSMAKYLGRDPGIGYYALALMVAYHFLAVRRIFGEGLFSSAVKAAGLALASGLIMVPLGQKALFWIVWFTTAP